ncbi:MAG: hypothetical protein EOP33_00970 [Rickettsiaceae bacterium]|nr:MAG: hypothetical protein EOP33_00970 [Rickettsiaceae bacterium]
MKKNEITIISKANNISKQARKVFKEFILSENREINYSHCKSLKKIKNIDGLINKLDQKRNTVANEPQDLQKIKSNVKKLIKHIDENAYVYYAIAKNLESSNHGLFPNEMIMQILNYVNGDIEGLNQNSTIVDLCGVEIQDLQI